MVVIAVVLAGVAVGRGSAQAQTCGQQATPDNTVVCASCDNNFSVAVNGEGDKVVAATPVLSNVRYFYQRDYANVHEPLWISEERYDLHSSPEALIVDGGAHGGKSLYFHGSPLTGINDRSEINLSQSGGPRSSVQEFGEWRYLRFFIKVDATFGTIDGQTASNGEALIMQAWQRSSQTVGPPFGIALQRSTDPSFPVNARFFYRNEYANDEVHCLTGGADRVDFYTEKLPANQWIGFIVQFKPSYVPHTAVEMATAARGAILVWTLKPLYVAYKPGQSPLGWVSACAESTPSPAPLSNGYDAVPGTYPYRTKDACNGKDESTYHFYWGYRPKQSAGMENKFEIRMGMYRNVGVPVSYWLDSIKLTTNEALLPGLGESRAPFTCPEWPGPFTCPN